MKKDCARPLTHPQWQLQSRRRQPDSLLSREALISDARAHWPQMRICHRSHGCDGSIHWPVPLMSATLGRDGSASLRSFPVAQRALPIVSVGISPHIASQPVSPADLYGAARCDLLPDGTSDGDRPPRRRVAAACVRLLTRSFAKRLCTCTFTVCSESAILCAISLF